MRPLSHLLLILLLPVSCSTPERLPEGPLTAVLRLPTGALILARTKVSIKSRIDQSMLGELFTCALEQSPTLDFYFPPPGTRPMVKPTVSMTIDLAQANTNPDRFHLVARIKRHVDGKKITCRVPIESADTNSLLAGVDAMARTVRRTLGEKVPAILAGAIPVADLCTNILPTLASLCLARSKLRAGDFKQALQATRAALGTDPSCGRALVLRAAIMAAQNQKTAADHILNQALFTTPTLTLVDQHRIKMIKLSLLGKWEELLAAGQEMKHQMPANPIGRESCGLAMNRLGRYQEAEKQLGLLANRRPLSAPVQMQLGIARFGLGDHAGAIRAFAKFEELGGSIFSARFFMTIVLGADGQWEKVQALLADQLEKARGSARTRAKLQRCLCATALLQGSLPLAKKAIKAILVEGKIDPAGCLSEWTLACRLLIFLGENKQVSTFLDDLPGFSMTTHEKLRLANIWLRGLIAANKGYIRLAENAASQLKQHGCSFNALQINALLDKLRNNNSGVISNLQQAAKREPNFWNRFLLGQAWTQQGEVDKAREILSGIEHQGLGLDLEDLGSHPMASPISAIALVESRRLLSRLSTLQQKLHGKGN